MKFLTVCLVLGVVGYGAALNCPTGMSENGGSCYVAVTSAKNFADANQYCRSTYAGSSLTSIVDAAENAHVRSLTSGSIWIGARARVSASRKYFWQNVLDSTTCGETFCYTNWQSGEPNNIHGAGESAEDCLEMYSSGTWNDQTCSDQRSFVCKV